MCLTAERYSVEEQVEGCPGVSTCRYCIDATGRLGRHLEVSGLGSWQAGLAYEQPLSLAPSPAEQYAGSSAHFAEAYSGGGQRYLGLVRDQSQKAEVVGVASSVGSHPVVGHEQSGGYPIAEGLFVVRRE